VSVWRPVTNAVLSALLSPPCAACAAVLENPLDGAVCARCWQAVRPHAVATCQSCAAIERGVAVGDYDGTLRDIIHALKYDGRRSVAPRLARIMKEYGGAVLQGVDVVVPVPLHRARERERGFNQADDLARGLGVPVATALRRMRHTPPQVSLSAADRAANVREAFALAPRFVVSQRVVVLVDDVITTGATLDACARVLKRAGAREVRALTAARVATEAHSKP
jgi:ComF family protein